MVTPKGGKGTSQKRKHLSKKMRKKMLVKTKWTGTTSKVRTRRRKKKKNQVTCSERGR